MMVSINQRLDADTPSPLGATRFDLACMFSVITHQQPEEAKPIFSFLRRHIKPDGHLFFSAFIHDGHVSYAERDPENGTWVREIDIDRGDD